VRHRTRFTLDQAEHNVVHWAAFLVLRFGASILGVTLRTVGVTLRTACGDVQKTVLMGFVGAWA